MSFNRNGVSYCRTWLGAEQLRACIRMKLRGTVKGAHYNNK